jgi:5-aminolevulinate synthase
MTEFHAFCRASPGEIPAPQRYRNFMPLRRQADCLPIHRDADGKDVLVWSSNDHLVMGGHLIVVVAACAAGRCMGAGDTRNISGTSPLHDALEADLAALPATPGIPPRTIELTDRHEPNRSCKNRS